MGMREAIACVEGRLHPFSAQAPQFYLAGTFPPGNSCAGSTCPIRAIFCSRLHRLASVAGLCSRHQPAKDSQRAHSLPATRARLRDLIGAP